MKTMNIKLATRLMLSFGIVIVMFIVLGGLAILGVGRIIDNSGEVTRSNTLRNQIARREVDHLSWTSSVQNAMIRGTAKDLNVQVDPHKCAFGKWYYGDDRKKAEAVFPGIGDFLGSIENPTADCTSPSLPSRKTLIRVMS